MGEDKFKIDSHKLIYHVDRVSDWKRGKDIYPIYIEISPSGGCNHRCVFCAVDYLGYKSQLLDTEMMRERLPEMARLGIKSIMYAGEGEPFLHKDLAELIIQTDDVGIDVAVTTNGVLMSPEISKAILPHTKWIKISCNAGTPEGYAKIHRTSSSDFDKVVKNIRAAVKMRNQMDSDCTLGVQLILLPQNVDEIIGFSQVLKDAGVNYFVVKPYTRHPKNKHEEFINYRDYDFLQEELEAIATDSFHIVFRKEAMRAWDQKSRPVERCLALPFWAYIDGGGNVRGCQAHLLDDRFLYGNLNENSFAEIWDGPVRKEKLQWVEENYDTSSCKINCRMSAINRYLKELIDPVPHVNFI